MRIIRFQDETGATCLGQDLGNGAAAVLEGGLFDLKPTSPLSHIPLLAFVG